MAEQELGHNGELDLIKIFGIAKKNIKFIATIFFISVIVTGIVTYFFIPKKYQSSTTFYLQEKNSSGALALISSQLGSLGGMVPGLAGGGTNSDLCSEIVMAPTFLGKVLKAEKLPATPKDVEDYGKLVKVEKKKSGALSISVIWTDPYKVYRLTRRIFADYRTFVDEQVNVTNSANRRFLEGQFSKSKERLDRAEAALLKYQKEKGVLLLPDEASKLIESFADLEKQKVESNLALSEARVRLKEADRILTRQAPEVKMEVTDTINPVLQKYKEKLTEIEVSLAKARESFTDQHPTVKSLLSQRDALLAQMGSEKVLVNSPDVAGEYLKGLVETTGLEARQSSLATVYTEAKHKMTGLPDELYAYGQLVREQKVAEQIYLLLTSQLEQAKIAEDKEDNVVIQVIDPPVVPYRKFGPSTTKNMIIVGMLVIFSTVFGCVAKEFINNRKMDSLSMN